MWFVPGEKVHQSNMSMSTEVKDMYIVQRIKQIDEYLHNEEHGERGWFRVL